MLLAGLRLGRAIPGTLKACGGAINLEGELGLYELADGAVVPKPDVRRTIELVFAQGQPDA